MNQKRFGIRYWSNNMKLNTLKFDVRKIKAFRIKETDSLQKIDEMQRELKETIQKLQKLYDEIQRFREEKAFKEAFDE